MVEGTPNRAVHFSQEGFGQMKVSNNLVNKMNTGSGMNGDVANLGQSAGNGAKASGKTAAFAGLWSAASGAVATFSALTFSAVALSSSGFVFGQYVQPQFQGSPYTSNQVAPVNQNWAQELFSDFDHDFGTVARAAKAEHSFEFKNKFNEPIEILNVTPSCTCTLPAVSAKVIAPGEEGAVIAKFQTRTSKGQRAATLNISMKKGNSYATALVKVKGYIRTDVVVHPESLEMPKVNASEGGQAAVKILYAGRSDWKITEIKCDNPAISITPTETVRQNGRVEYELQAALGKSLPSQEIVEVITVFTNDLNLKSFTVPFHARVVQPIRFFDTITMDVFEGDTATQKILMASGDEFQVIDYSCESCPLKVNLDGEKKKAHSIVVEAQGLAEGRSEHILSLKTNHPGQEIANVKLIINVQTGK